MFWELRRVLGRHREVVEILADMLKAAGSTGASKTRIMYRANLSYKLLEKYLEMTIQSGLLGFNGSGYVLSPAGKVFLEAFESYVAQTLRVKGSLRELGVRRERLEQVIQGHNGNKYESNINSNGSNGYGRGKLSFG